ncbi:carbamoyltransferase [Reticulibacter mediterranei]|uniref:Carbamoyltransferase n=1 Tax=Reticulibacter mediterranei TaxID=2778369 RepID=A0A8J3J080_9CHLR|nr:carbamoyltransferase HypF [Reticulibacter mediterranei]GHO99960.1 carbamoyltransferase [Reticulibacter mediterranei]
MTNLHETLLHRQRLIVQGMVQGVGFRPFVYSQAIRHGLVGFVFNSTIGVTIEIEGTSQATAAFQRALREELPPLAHVVSLTCEPIPLHHETSFLIVHSEVGAERRAFISSDAATCDECLRELFDPTDRRYQYPFINCTNCGPRFTIIQDVPYDRDKTTMRVFPMCPSCQREYADPLNRRFHAQPNACPVCGPHVSLLGRREDGTMHHIECQTPITQAAQLLATGTILAVKGLGGYHLTCDAFEQEAVRRLRQGKQREAKPFALMVPDITAARQLCWVSEAEAQLLHSRHRPIVLLKRRDDNLVAPDVAPAYDSLGIMLPYTPLHHLLLSAFAAAHQPGRPTALVMTSGNLSEEPIAYHDEDAQQRLHTIAEAMLIHNRDIHMRCDDSVVQVTAGGEQFCRRARGYAPEPITLSFDLPVPLLACGAHLKNTFCLGKGTQAFVSHHIGDLENLETLLSFREGIEHFQRLFDIFPEAIAYDSHPEYLATKYALDTPIPRKIAVQHHHAHIASVMAEHGITEPVIGIAADGSGYGTDGAIWGCEIMMADLLQFQRLAHLAYIPLPGGEQAVRQPWRMGAVYLSRAYGDAFLDLDIPFVRAINRARWHILSQMIEKGVNCPPTSSLGRLFDAVAALLGLHAAEVAYEGQAAIALEVLAATCRDQVTSYPFHWQQGEPAILDVIPIITAITDDILRGEPPARIARRFHLSITHMLTIACVEARKQAGCNRVALSGGVFQNRLLLEQLMTNLEERAFQVSINRRVPPNDGGISLGQLAVAAAHLRT